jgi:hypothetical protein
MSIHPEGNCNSCSDFGSSAFYQWPSWQTNNSASIIQMYKDKAVGRGFMPVGRLVAGKVSVELPKMMKVGPCRMKPVETCVASPLIALCWGALRCLLT